MKGLLCCEERSKANEAYQTHTEGNNEESVNTCWKERQDRRKRLVHKRGRVCLCEIDTGTQNRHSKDTQEKCNTEAAEKRQTRHLRQCIWSSQKRYDTVKHRDHCKTARRKRSITTCQQQKSRRVSTHLSHSVVHAVMIWSIMERPHSYISDSQKHASDSIQIRVHSLWEVWRNATLRGSFRS